MRRCARRPIVEVAAAAQILVEQGYESTTTARVAERAGVSIGSLYQYFPNKEALVAALIERHAGDMIAILREALANSANTTIEDGLRSFIRAGVMAHQVDPALHKILFEQVPRVGQLAHTMDTSQEVTRALELFLHAHADEMRPDLDPALAAIVVETAIEAIVHKAVIERRDLLADGAIAREALDLATRYLCRQDC